ncbi:PaaI family thioesterase [Paenibacillus sp. NEAU-GSW1]|uniref:PaaI family thioesterase n=1 Tax=Paenibacillus sp. NEAU-GSW1 TaxID=2682486 RepID=UPI0034649CBC
MSFEGDRQWDDASSFIAGLGEQAQQTFWGDLGCEVVRADGQKAVISLKAEQRHLNLLGIVHGGVLMSLIDNAMGLAVMLAYRDQKTVTANMNTHFLENTKKGTLYCEGSIMHRIGRTITLQASVTNEEGRLIAWGSGAYRIVTRTG